MLKYLNLVENSIRPGSKGENPQLFNSNVWISSEANSKNINLLLYLYYFINLIKKINLAYH